MLAHPEGKEGGSEQVCEPREGQLESPPPGSSGVVGAESACHPPLLVAAGGCREGGEGGLLVWILPAPGAKGGPWGFRHGCPGLREGGGVEREGSIPLSPPPVPLSSWCTSCGRGFPLCWNSRRSGRRVQLAGRGARSREGDSWVGGAGPQTKKVRPLAGGLPPSWTPRPPTRPLPPSPHPSVPSQLCGNRAHVGGVPHAARRDNCGWLCWLSLGRSRERKKREPLLLFGRCIAS